MQAEAILQHLRRFLLLVALAIFVATPIELWFTEHFGSPPQIIPFILCGFGLVVTLAFLAQPSRMTWLTLRVVMVFVILGALLGAYEHLEHNLAFELEIRPNAAAGDVILDALRGANPLLASGILALGALLAWGATYQHSAAQQSLSREE